MKSEYEIQAEQFLRNHNARMTISHVTEYGQWKTSEMTGGWLYRVRIDRNGKSWSFNFSDSKYNYWYNKRPTKYDVHWLVVRYEYPSVAWL